MRECADRIIPRLGELLTDGKASYNVLVELTGYGPQAADLVPALAAALKDQDPRVAIRAALTLAVVDPGCKEVAVAGLVALLSNTETASSRAGPSCRPQDVCSALLHLGEDPVPHVLPLLRRQTKETLSNYVEALAGVGEPAVPALRQELRGASVTGRIGAARALGMLAARAQAAFPDLEAVLQDADADVRGAAAEALVEIDAGRAGPAVPQLIARLPSADATLRDRVVKLLARIGKAAEPAVPALTQLLTDPDVRLEAAKALVEIDPAQAGPAVPVFVGILESNLSAGNPWPQIHAQLLEALGRIGTLAAEAVPVIRRFLQGQDTYDHIVAAQALLRVAAECTAEAVTALVRIVEEGGNGDPLLVSEVLTVLVEIGPAVVEYVPRLEAVLFDKEKRQQLWADEFFSRLLEIDGAAAARIRARLEADLQTSRHFAESVRLLTDLRRVIPATWVPLLDSLLQDKRARREWNTIRSLRDELRGEPAGD
jgi:HEAT repeat protein